MRGLFSLGIQTEDQNEGNKKKNVYLMSFFNFTYGLLKKLKILNKSSEGYFLLCNVKKSVN